MAENELTVSILNDLIRTSKDGEQYFEHSVEHVQDSQLKAFFIRRAHEVSVSAAELRDLVVSLGGVPVDAPSVDRASHRYWNDLESAIDLAVLDEVERGEGFALKAYRKAAEQTLPSEVRSVVLRQFDGVRHHYEEVKTLRDSAHTAAG